MSARNKRAVGSESAPMGNGPRAFWTFLMSTLVAPFLAAVVILLASIIAGRIGRGPASLLALDQAGQLAWAAQKAVEAYVWCAIPAAISGAIAAAVVYARGTLPWLAAATIAAVVGSAVAFTAGGMLAQHITPIALIAAVVGIATQALIKRGGILS